MEAPAIDGLRHRCDSFNPPRGKGELARVEGTLTRGFYA